MKSGKKLVAPLPRPAFVAPSSRSWPQARNFFNHRLSIADGCGERRRKVVFVRALAPLSGRLNAVLLAGAENSSLNRIDSRSAVNLPRDGVRVLHFLSWCGFVSGIFCRCEGPTRNLRNRRGGSLALDAHLSLNVQT